LHILPIKFLI